MASLRLAAFLSSALVVSAFNVTSKRGMAFSAPDTPGDIANANQTKSQISWQYDWGSSPPAYLAIDGIEYIPMQWGSVGIEGFANSVKTQNAKTILVRHDFFRGSSGRLTFEEAFNEPDFDQESNILPDDAAKLWKQYLEPMKAEGVRLGGPAITGSPTGQPWLSQFMQACTNCSVDFIPLHWYGEGVEGFYNYLWDVHNAYPKIPIWVTEYASTSSNATEVSSFLNATMVYMDSLPWIERYAWFGYFRPRETGIYNLLGEDGSLNTLGQMYVGAKTVHTQIVTQAPTKTFTSVNGADNPTQGLVTTYASVPNGATRGWSVFGADHDSQALRFGLALVACVVGAGWTVF
ncbi:hypothetical protein H0H87_006961 [Tephrocybe sp. NHM501043]|nr:hypothetical protein H0H87_006961 [Tephrocybe sp. NHM501043]